MNHGSQIFKFLDKNNKGQKNTFNHIAKMFVQTCSLLFGAKFCQAKKCLQVNIANVILKGLPNFKRGKKHTELNLISECQRACNEKVYC